MEVEAEAEAEEVAGTNPEEERPLAKVAEGAVAAGIWARFTLLILEIVVENALGLIWTNARFSVKDANVPSSNRS